MNQNQPQVNVPGAHPNPKEAWVAELRSGVHQQCTQVLHNGESYCAFGVLLYEVLHRSPYDWRGMLEREYGLTDAEITKIANANDGGASFADIADYIEANVSLSSSGSGVSR